jgi:hypothetical protein
MTLGDLLIIAKELAEKETVRNTKTQKELIHDFLSTANRLNISTESITINNKTKRNGRKA